ncbi:MAG: hypothetical protein JWQ25_1449, partial [Daejeonella sp.]|nr:hypothetical protein [Daejeonella sp.]
MNFYQQPIESLITDFHSDIKAGLRDEDIENTRRKYGKNSLKAANSRSFLKILLAQFISPLVIILIAAAMFSFYLGQVRDGCILLIIVVTNALIGFYQEWKSENIIASLKNLVVNKCNVIRNGKASQINAEDLVPGDLVQLYEGDGIPADLRLIEANGFSANEFILTGESLPASKDPLFKTEETLLIGDIKNCVFMGTTAARGNAKGLVYACGMQTEIGKISISSEKIKTVEAPVQTEIADIAKKISYATLVIGLILFCTRLLLHDSLGAALVFAVSIAAAMVPEGLPAQISAALALAAGRLSKKNAIVKRLSAAQTLGSATVIASDKTGTITKNEMTITG